MNPSQKKQVHSKILSTIEEINASIPGLKEGAKPISLDEPIGRITRMDAMVNQGINQRKLQDATERLKRLETALERIKGKEFGLCVLCEEEIPLKRLLAIPETQACVGCTK